VVQIAATPSRPTPPDEGARLRLTRSGNHDSIRPSLALAIDAANAESRLPKGLPPIVATNIHSAHLGDQLSPTVRPQQTPRRQRSTAST